MKLIKKGFLPFLIILMLAAFLRLVNINNNPASMYGDELSLVYDSYSILHTGHDQSGQFLPLIFQQGGGRLGGYVYLSAPFVGIFGMTSLGVRFLSVLSGLGLVILVYFFCREYFNEKVGLIASFLWAISPWDIGLSRGGFETHLALFWGFLGVYSFLKAAKNLNWYLLSAVSFFLAAFTYQTYELIGPLLIVLLILFTGRFKSILGNLKNLVVGLFVVIFVLNLGLSAFLTLDLGRNNRFQAINVLSQSDVQNSIAMQVNTERSFSSLPSHLSLVLNNKFVENLELVGENYLDNFFPDFLFLHGDSNPVHNPATMGEFYIVELLFIVYGGWALSKKDSKFLKILIIWILIAPLATSLVGSPHALRSDFLLPPLLVLSAYGLYNLAWSGRNKFVLAGIFMIFLVQFAIFIDRVYFIAPSEYSRLWAYPSKMAANLAKEERDRFDYVILSQRLDNIQYAYPVYANISPDLVINQYLSPINLGKYTFKRYGNVYIGEIPKSDTNNFIKSLKGSVIFIGSPDEENGLTDYQSYLGLDHVNEVVVDKKNNLNQFFK